MLNARFAAEDGDMETDHETPAGGEDGKRDGTGEDGDNVPQTGL